jgi:hypothetical protein
VIAGIVTNLAGEGRLGTASDAVTEPLSRGIAAATKCIRSPSSRPLPIVGEVVDVENVARAVSRWRHGKRGLDIGAPGNHIGVSNTNPKHPGRAAESNRAKDPQDWVTADEPMTGAQASYLKTLCEEAGEPFEEGLTKAEASRRIDQLKQTSDRAG